MTRAELDKQLKEFRIQLLDEYDNKPDLSPVEFALKRLECLPIFSKQSVQDDSKWMFREGVRKFREVARTMVSPDGVFSHSMIDEIEKELLA